MIPLLSTVDADKVEASFKDGVLEITLPKSAEAKPKKIAVAAKRKLAAKEESSKEVK